MQKVQSSFTKKKKKLLQVFEVSFGLDSEII